MVSCHRFGQVDVRGFADFLKDTCTSDRTSYPKTANFKAVSLTKAASDLMCGECWLTIQILELDDV